MKDIIGIEEPEYRHQVEIFGWLTQFTEGKGVAEWSKAKAQETDNPGLNPRFLTICATLNTLSQLSVG